MWLSVNWPKIEHVSESLVRAAERLRVAADARSRAEVEEAVAIVELARACEWPEDAAFDVVGTRPVRIGADGTALFDEFLPLEVAAIKGISVASATWLIRDLVNLSARHPQLWFQVRRGRLPVYRACQLAAEAARYELSRDQAHALDAALAPKVATLPWPRVLRLARGLIAQIASDKIAELAERARAARYVRRYPTEDTCVGFIAARRGRGAGVRPRRRGDAADRAWGGPGRGCRGAGSDDAHPSDRSPPGAADSGRPAV